MWRHYPPLLHTHIHPHTPTHTHAIGLHVPSLCTQTKQCYRAAVALLMCRACWSQLLSHTHRTYVSYKRGRFYASSLPGGNFHFSFSLRSFDQNPPRLAKATLRDLPRGVNVDVQVKHKGRIWDASGKTNKYSDSCQQHLSYLHFLMWVN